MPAPWSGVSPENERALSVVIVSLDATNASLRDDTTATEKDRRRTVGGMLEAPRATIREEVVGGGGGGDDDNGVRGR